MKEWVWKLPAFLLASAAVAAGVMHFIGVQAETVPERLENHMAQEVEWHQQDSALDSGTALHLKHVESRQERIEDVFFMEQCLENSYTMLARQRILARCDSLGVRRNPGDLPPGTLP